MAMDDSNPFGDIDQETFVDSIPRPVKTYHSSTYARVNPSQYHAAGKTVFITGGASGVGYSISKSFAEAGTSRIVIVSRSSNPLAEAKANLASAYPKVKFETHSASLTDHAAMKSVLDGVDGGIDILVLCAAGIHAVAYTDQVPTSEIGSKTVINVSTASIHLYIPSPAGYGASKFTFYDLFRRSAAEQPFSDKEHLVRMFTYHPGAFDTLLVASTGIPSDPLPWEDINLPGYFATLLALSGEADFLHGRFVWAF